LIYIYIHLYIYIYIYTIDVYFISGQYYLEATRQWIIDEAARCKNITYGVKDWKMVHRKKDIPQQDNGSDCGMYILMYADFLSDDLLLSFKPTNMLSFRTKVGTDLMRKRFLY